MNIEISLKNAIDLFVDGEEQKAEELLNEIIAKIKTIVKTSPESQMYLYWAQALEVMDEFEQAALKYEEAMNLDPSNEEAIWGFAQMCQYSLQKPQMTIALIRDHLFKVNPNFEGAQELLDMAQGAFDPLETVELEIDPEKK